MNDFYRFMEGLPDSGNLIRNELAQEIMEDLIERMSRMVGEAKNNYCSATAICHLLRNDYNLYNRFGFLFKLIGAGNRL